MSLTTQVERGRWRAVAQLVAVGGIVALLVAAAVGYRLTRGPDPQTVSQPAGTAGVPAPTTTATTAGTWTGPPVSAGPLILPTPARTVRGVPLGYPHSTEGAISAAAHYTEAAVTLDANRARTVGELAGAPSYLSAADDFAANVGVARTQLGVSATGPTGSAYLTYQAQAYLVLDATPDRVEVWVLGTADGAGPSTGGDSRTGPSIARLVMVWVEGDWRLTDNPPTDAPSAAPEPATPKAYAQGWRDCAIA